MNERLKRVVERYQIVRKAMSTNADIVNTPAKMGPEEEVDNAVRELDTFLNDYGPMTGELLATSYVYVYNGGRIILGTCDYHNEDEGGTNTDTLIFYGHGFCLSTERTSSVAVYQALAGDIKVLDPAYRDITVFEIVTKASDWFEIKPSEIVTLIWKKLDRVAEMALKVR